MLKVENLSTSYKLIDGDVHVLNDLNFEIHDNEIFGIAGESGCGKTTLLKTLYDIIEFPLEIDKGKVILSGEKNGQSFSYESGNIQKTWWNNISYVPQAAQSVLNPIVRLKKQFLDSIPQEDRKNETKEQTLARVAKYLEELNLSPDILESYPFQLSGGMRQRVGIAMGMSYQPKLLLADEPTGSVDTATSKLILDVFRELNRAMGVTIIIVTHDTKLSAQIDRVVAIRDGKTSTELVRKSGIAKSFGELNEQEENSHEELTVLDRAGRLQIPKEYLEELGLRGGDKVRVELEEGKISIYPRGIADKASK